VVGGFGSNGQWINDVWYAAFSTPPDSPPTWTQLTNQGVGAPTNVVGCTTEYWSAPRQLQLIAMGTPSGNGMGPSDGLWLGEVTYNS
jgi:hypothetical protein